METTLGTLKQVPLTTVWKHEALDFTKWLADNLDPLGDALKMDLEWVQTEAPVGRYFLDVLARDTGTGRLVAIENQFGTSNHDHMGKLLMYSAGYDVATVVWIAEDFNDEYRQALDWLNRNSTPELNFFGVEASLIQVDDSNPAVVFRPVALPNEWAKETRRRGTTAGTTELRDAYREFFQPVVDEVRQSGFRGMVKARPQNWIQFGASASGVTYALAFSKNGLRAEVYLGNTDPDWNTRLLDWLQKSIRSIHMPFTEPLQWETLDSRMGCRIAVYTVGEVTDREGWSKLRQWGVDRLRHMKHVFDPLLEEYSRSEEAGAL